jgi:hypothetical protein
VARITQTLRIYRVFPSSARRRQKRSSQLNKPRRGGSLPWPALMWQRWTPRPGASPAMPAGDRDLDRAAEGCFLQLFSSILLVYPNILLERDGMLLPPVTVSFLQRRVREQRRCFLQSQLSHSDAGLTIDKETKRVRLTTVMVGMDLGLQRPDVTVG